jgi:AraC-like DNA-binding protein
LHKWTVHFDNRLGTKQHELAPGVGQALAAAVAVNAFQVLGVSATIWEHGKEWLPLHSEPTIVPLEVHYDKWTLRTDYNAARLNEAIRKKRTVLGRHAGHLDVFAPIVIEGFSTGVLVVGPVAVGRFGAAELENRWRRLTGRRAHPTDPSFAAFVETTLAVLTLEHEDVDAFVELVESIALLLAGRHDACPLLNRVEVLRTRLERARAVERSWNAAREMLDERSSQLWQDVFSYKNLLGLGLSRTPDDVLVGLTTAPSPSVDPVEQLVRRNAFQRRCVDLAEKVGDAIAGRLGDYGVVFLCSAPRSSLQTRNQRLRTLVDKADSLATRSFGLRVHFGAGTLATTEPLYRKYQAALDAAEAAVARKERVCFAASGNTREGPSLHALRRQLAAIAEQHPEQLGPRFDRYVEAVAAQHGHRLGALQGHLEAGFDAMTTPLLDSGTLDERSHRALTSALDRAAGEARTSSEYVAAYARAVSGVADAVRRPVVARRARGIDRALEHIDRHYGDVLSLGQVARIAGMADARFSRLFKESEGVTFQSYLRTRRRARAEHLLSSTGLGVARVAEMSGWRSVAYFCRDFKRATGRTPTEFRAGRQVQTKVKEVQRRRGRAR